MDRPILFSAPMVRAILDGTKTQTRRLVKPATPHGHNRCPYGQPGDRLWVRETHAFIDGGGYDSLNGDYHDFYSVGGPVKPGQFALAYRADDAWQDQCNSEGIAWRPSICMPRWASRITLEVTGVRVERLCSITSADVLAEGTGLPVGTALAYGSVTEEWNRRAYSVLWESIHGPGAWGANPWVWVVQFKRVEVPRE